MATNPSNAYRNGTMYSSYTAASLAREYELADKYKINFLGSVSWSFEFEDQPWFYGFRDLATNGVDKPVLNVFRMFGKMKGQRVKVTSDRMYDRQAVIDSGIKGATTDIGALASKDKKSAAVMVWNYHDDAKRGTAEPVAITLAGIPAAKVKITQWLIDEAHSNSYEAWKKMGSPQSPTAAQVALLQKAGQLEKISPTHLQNVKGGTVRTVIELSRQGVALIQFEW